MAKLKLPKHLCGILDIEMSIPPERIAPNLVNLASSPAAEIISLVFEPLVYLKELAETLDDDSDVEVFRSLTTKELASVAYDAPEITLMGAADIPVTHRAPNGIHFTLGDLVVAIEETERQTRGRTVWFGGADIHHVFFERLALCDDQPDTFRIEWGS